MELNDGPFSGTHPRPGSAPFWYVAQSGRSLKNPTRTGAENVTPPSVDRARSTWLRFSPPDTALLKLLKTTYRVPSGAVNGCESWFSLQVPFGVGTPNVLSHKELVLLTRAGALNVWP